jgi:hypothetical protein
MPERLKKARLLLPAAGLLVLVLLFSVRATRPAAGMDHALARRQAAPAGGPAQLANDDLLVRIEADPAVRRYYLPPPELPERTPDAVETTNIVVNYHPSSCPSGAITPWSNQARNAFGYAVQIWESILNGPQTIEVDACWRNDMASTTLGSAGPRDYYRDFSGAPRSGTWYAVPLANQLSNSDLNGGNAEISANFNSSFNWYLGTDGQPSSTEYDFVSVVLHEIGHGLGFSGSMVVDNGTGNNECNGTAGVGCWGAGTAYPFIYDRFTENGAGTALLAFPNNSTSLGSQLTSNDVFFDGSNANASNGGDPAELYAPSTWNFGSSYSHLGEVFNGTNSALMTFSLGFAEAVHHPGPVALGILDDTGWNLRNLWTVYVDDSNNSGTETGSSANPFNTVEEGVRAVYTGGWVYLRSGSYNETSLLYREMILDNDDTGSALIGQ